VILKYSVSSSNSSSHSSHARPISRYLSGILNNSIFSDCFLLLSGLQFLTFCSNYFFLVAKCSVTKDRPPRWTKLIFIVINKSHDTILLRNACEGGYYNSPASKFQTKLKETMHIEWRRRPSSR